MHLKYDFDKSVADVESVFILKKRAVTTINCTGPRKFL